MDIEVFFFSSPGTFFKNVDYLDSGTNLIIDKNFKLKFKSFWKKKCLQSQGKEFISSEHKIKKIN